MKIPVLVLLAYAGWTLLTLATTVGAYRWSRILTGQAPIAYWRADLAQGCDWYQRAMRAHMNCVENLPVYAALVVAQMAMGVQSAVVDGLAMTMLAARIGQTLVHVGLAPTNAAVSLRFALFFVQILSMAAMGGVILARTL